MLAWVPHDSFPDVNDVVDHFIYSTAVFAGEALPD
jgi:hypothetical protein